MIMGDGTGFVDLGGYLVDDGLSPARDGGALAPGVPWAGESLRLAIVRPPVLQAAPGPGRCRRPVEGPVAGYIVNRTAAVAGDLDQVDEDGDGPPWSVGDVADVYPVRALSRACGQCWACRLPRAARVLERVCRVAAAVRRRSVTVAVVVLMVAPAVAFLWLRWVVRSA